MAESFTRELKREEGDGWAYRDLHDAKPSVGTFLKKVHNRQASHSALVDLAAPAE